MNTTREITVHANSVIAMFILKIEVSDIKTVFLSAIPGSYGGVEMPVR